MIEGPLEAVRWFLVVGAELALLFLILGFLISLLRTWIPEERVRALFEARGATRGYVIGAFLGAVTPFCSYSTVPVLAGLLRSKVPFGPTITFLFASPLLDPVVLGVLVFVIGVKGTVVYALVTFLGSVGMGALWARLGLEADVKKTAVSDGARVAGQKDGSAWRRSWSESWGLFVSAVPYLLLGTAIGAVIYGFVPTDWIVAVAGPEQPLAIPLAAVLGVPVYVNAETFFPIAAALLDKGVGTGAVVALIVTGMGVSVPEMALLASLFRLRLVAVVVASVFAVAVGSGAVFALVVG